jgi:phosphoribosyl 1,2-cyclic phosphodiesterase
MLREAENHLGITFIVEAIVVTHLHGDHAGTLNVLVNTLRPNLVILPNLFDEPCNPELSKCEEMRGRLREAIDKLIARRVEIRLLRSGESTLLPLTEALVSGIEVPHDTFCLGLSLDWGAFRLSYLVDLGSTNGSILDFVLDSEVLVMEMNYDVQLIDSDLVDYAEKLKDRIKSDRGHLSNLQASRFIRNVLERSSRMRSLILGHLGGQTNSEAHVMHAVRSATEHRAIDIKILPRQAGKLLQFFGKFERSGYKIDSVEEWEIILPEKQPRQTGTG